MNPRTAINGLHPFQGCPFSLLGTSPYGEVSTAVCRTVELLTHCLICVFEGKPKRRMWDSNPRFLSESPVFKTGALNHSANSPKNASTKITQALRVVKHFRALFIPAMMNSIIPTEIAPNGRFRPAPVRCLRTVYGRFVPFTERLCSHLSPSFSPGTAFSVRSATLPRRNS